MSEPAPREKVKVFISYSRAELAFADELVAGLEYDGAFAVTIDRHSIVEGEDWKKRLGALIADADTVVFVLSPASAKSDICTWEVEESVYRSKRIVPVLAKPLEGIPAPSRLAALNYVRFDEGRSFMAGLKALTTALKTDVDWLREHTRLLARAMEWQAGGRAANRLLSGDDIAAAKAWAARRPKDAPEPTSLHLDFIKASEQAEDARLTAERQQLAEIAAAQARTARLQRRAQWALAIIAALVVIGLGTVSWQQRRVTSEHEANIALQVSLDNSGRELLNNQRRLQHEHASLLGQFASAEVLSGNIDGALRFSAAGAQSDLTQPLGTLVASAATTQLAATVSQTYWRLVLHAQSVVNSAAFSPDGTRVVTASVDKTARIWDAVTGKEVTVLRGHEDVVFSAAFSPDGTRIVTVSKDMTTRIWDTAVAKEVWGVDWRNPDRPAYAAFSPDGTRVVTALLDETASIWDARIGEITVLRGHEGAVTSSVFSPDGTRVVTASVDKTARIWDAATGKEITVLRGHEGAVTSSVFSPDGTRVVTASVDKTARIWDAATGKEITVLRGHTSQLNSATFSPDGTRIVTASDDKTARIWDAVAGKEVTVLRGHEDRVNSAAFSPDGTHIVTASWDKTARIWDAAAGKEITVLRGHEGYVVSAAFSPDGTRIVTASWDKTARIWDAASGNEIIVLRGHEDTVLSAAFSTDGTRIVTASEDKTARIWDAATGNDHGPARARGWRHFLSLQPGRDAHRHGIRRQDRAHLGHTF
jgi:WD40 repeat protein